MPWLEIVWPAALALTVAVIVIVTVPLIAAVNNGTNTVTWNGGLAAGASVTINIVATIKAGTTGQTISNQGTISYDSNGDGTNDATVVTDDPGTAAAGDPTSFVVAATAAAVPTLSDFGLATLALALAAAALLMVRRRRTV